MSEQTVSIHLIKPSLDPSPTDRLCLTAEESKRASSFRFENDANRWVSYRAALRRLLSSHLNIAPQDLPIISGEFGKPALAIPFGHLQFSLSHTNDLGLLAISTSGPVGIDLEAATRAPDLLGCESTFCHPAEINELPVDAIERGHQLLELWIAKEALLKAFGTGFSHAPETVRIHLGASSVGITAEADIVGIDGLRIRRLQHPALGGFRAMLCSQTGSARIEIEDSTILPASEIVPPSSSTPDG